MIFDCTFTHSVVDFSKVVKGLVTGCRRPFLAFDSSQPSIWMTLYYWQFCWWWGNIVVASITLMLDSKITAFADTFRLLKITAFVNILFWVNLLFQKEAKLAHVHAQIHSKSCILTGVKAICDWTTRTRGSRSRWSFLRAMFSPAVKFEGTYEYIDAIFSSKRSETMTSFEAYWQDRTV